MGYCRSFVLLICILNGYVRGETLCSAINRQSDLQGCLDSTYNLANNDTYFWFGVGYDTRCPAGSDNPDMCPIGPTEPTLAGKVFTPLTFTATSLTQYLNVRFQSPPGVYEGCRNSYTIMETKDFTIDALDAKPVNAWDTRIMPTLDWTVTPGSFYTLIVVDVGIDFIHGLYTNIQSTDLANADIVASYVGPGNPRSIPTPYAFILYEQPGRITVAQSWYTQLQTTFRIDINLFTTTHLLNEPIALNWVIVAADPYSIGRIYDVLGLQNYCPTLVTKELPRQQLPFVPADARLTVNLDVTYHSPALKFQSCCSQYIYDAVNISLNPLGDGQVTPGQARFEPMVELLKNIFRPNNTRDFAGKLFTLFMFDVDLSSPTYGTHALPLIHWSLINIEDGDITTGTTVHDYVGPRPRSGVNHYSFLLYEQTKQLSIDDLLQHAGSVPECSGFLENRCRYGMAAFISSNNLTLAGATWFLGPSNEFVKYTYVASGQPIDNVCQGVEGYVTDCPTGAGTVTHSTLCSEPARSRDLHSCLEAIYNLANDDMYFWFGDDYNTRCNGVTDANICPIGPTASTLSGRLFTEGTFTATSLHQYLDVQYVSPPGEYTGCGNTYTKSKGKSLGIDALSSVTITCWDSREAPTITWTIFPGTYYTLIFFDVGLGFIHSVFMNIRSTDYGSSRVLAPYIGPGNSRTPPSPYAYLLFEQNGQVAVVEKWLTILDNFDPFNITDFMMDHGLTGPIAMNWFMATADSYSIQRVKDRYGVANFCGNMISKELQRRQLSFLPSTNDLPLYMTVTYSSPQIQFESCCSSYTHEASDIVLNPLDEELRIAPVRTRERPRIVMEMNTSPNRTTAFAGKLLTLLFVDADVATPSIGTRDLPLLQWAVMNIEEGVVETGTTVIDYKIFYSPEGVHKKYFLVYEQTQSLGAATVKKYAGACASGLEGQCLYNITAFASENNLQLIGVSWMASAADEYARLQLIKQGTAEEVCKHVHGYTKGCATASDSGNPNISLVLIGISMVFCKIN